MLLARTTQPLEMAFGVRQGVHHTLADYADQPDIAMAALTSSNTVLLPIVGVNESHKSANVSAFRLLRLAQQATRLGFAMIPVPAVFSSPCCYGIIKAFEDAAGRCAASRFEYCILTESDAALHPDLLREATLTAQMLPATWQVLHLCSGFVWGRARRSNAASDSRLRWRMNPEWPIANDRGGRYFEEWPRELDCGPGHWNEPGCPLLPGGPATLLVRRKHALRYQALLQLKKVKWHSPDMIAAHEVRPGLDFLAREPQLCYETFFGSTYASNSCQSPPCS